MIKAGVKIAPPPIPSAPAAHPPRKPKAKRVLRDYPLHLISLLTMLMLPNLIFSCCSDCAMNTAMQVYMIQIAIKIACMVQ